MRQISPEEQASLLAKLRRHRKALQKFKGVNAVDVGFAFRDGKPTEELALRVHVTRKLPMSRLARAQVLPKSIGGLRVDVLQVVREKLVDPVIGGVGIFNAHHPQGNGTLGSIVFEPLTLEPLGLSCHHVLVGSDGQVDDGIKNAEGDVIGSLLRWNETFDCAVFRIDSGKPVSLDIKGIPTFNGAAGSAFPAIGMTVIKSGKTTGVTVGMVDGVGTDISIVPVLGNLVPFADHGDSGSLALATPSSAAIGLLSEKDKNSLRVFAKYAVSVEDALGIVIIPGAAVASPLLPGSYGSAIAKTDPGASCDLEITYPSGRHSRAKGLGKARGDAQGWARWHWQVAENTRSVSRSNPHNKWGTGHFSFHGTVRDWPFKVELPQHPPHP
jgi:hypothetical protein